MLALDCQIKAALDNTAKNRDNPPILAASLEIDHPDCTIYVWNGFTDINFNGVIYKGLAHLGSVTGVKSSDEIEVVEVTLQLSGLPADVLDKINDNVQGRKAYYRKLYLNKNFELIAPPVLIAEIELDRASYELSDDGTALYNLIGYTGFYFLQNAPGAKWSREDQAQLYPDDTGFDLVPEQAVKSITGWGY